MLVDDHFAAASTAKSSDQAELLSNNFDVAEDEEDDAELLNIFEYCQLNRPSCADCWKSLLQNPTAFICVMVVFVPIFLFLVLIYLAIMAPTADEASLSDPVDTSPRFYNSSKVRSIMGALCQEWHQGRYAGDFCDTLCADEHSRNWTLMDYIEGGDKRVLKMHLDGKDIILKMQHPYLADYDQQLDFGGVGEEEFTDKVLDIVNDHLRLDWPRRYKSHLLRKLWPPYQPGQPLSQAEMRSIWALIQQDEFINQAVLQQSRMISVCGHAYRSEYLIPFRMKPYYLNLKAKILVHLMGTLKFVMMDSDMLYTESKLVAMLTAQKCTNDSECGIFDCHSECNATTGFCTPRTNDNVDVFCKKLVTQLFGTFWSKSNKYLAACHQDPVNATQRLNELRLTWSWTLSDV